MGDKSLLDKSECWIERGLQSHYQNRPGGKRDTDWISNIVLFKYAGLYKVIMNCSTLLEGFYIFTRRQPEAVGSEKHESECLGECLSIVPCIYFHVCVCAVLRADAGQRQLLVCIRPGKAAQHLPTIMLVHNHNDQCQERATHTHTLLCVTLASVSVVQTSNWLLVRLMLLSAACLTSLGLD